MSKIKSAEEFFKNFKRFEFGEIIEDEIYVLSGNDLKEYADYVLKAKLESITDEVINNQGSKYSIETMSYLDEDVLDDFCQGAEWLKQKLLKDES